MDKVICLSIGSLLGGLARWMLTDYIGKRNIYQFPLGTLSVNLIGCLLIGVLMSLGEKILSDNARLLLMVGLCGAFTTFSTMMLEVSVLLDRGQWKMALAYVFTSFILGFLLLRLGANVGKFINTVA